MASEQPVCLLEPFGKDESFVSFLLWLFGGGEDDEDDVLALSEPFGEDESFVPFLLWLFGGGEDEEDVLALSRGEHSTISPTEPPPSTLSLLWSASSPAPFPHQPPCPRQALLAPFPPRQQLHQDHPEKVNVCLRRGGVGAGASPLDSRLLKPFLPAPEISDPGRSGARGAGRGAWAHRSTRSPNRKPPRTALVVPVVLVLSPSLVK
ncbi:hypothetical protein NL676_039634 [Syzygium grande]|nr:hypothetical protein NL676_039634 [Syzygium grande]